MGSPAFSPQNLDGRPGQIFFIFFIDFKSIEKQSYALNGHGIALNDPTIVSVKIIQMNGTYMNYLSFILIHVIVIVNTIHNNYQHALIR